MNTLTRLPQAVRAVQALREADGQDTAVQGTLLGKSRPCPIEVVNRAYSFFECTLKPSCVKINIYHSPYLTQGEAANP
jgi:hypothetical protein